ncbi:MAG TPA: GntR family transcriptional regulator [Dehalococcoidia bacterium]|nr:GntR family transcriptional regulator [Dehalococcoidia bacterium]
MVLVSDGAVEELSGLLDPTLRVPLYTQLEDALRTRIDDGRLAAGAVLPPEPELAERLGVSRQTVNQALTNLARRGAVTRRRGVGTFVARPFVEQPLDGLYSFLRTLLAQGRLPATRLLGNRITVDSRASPLLTGGPDGLVYEISRLRLVDGEPFVVETVYLGVGCGEALPRERLTREVLYDLLRECCGVEVTHAEETLRPVTVEQPEASLLGLQVGEPVFLVERTGYAGSQPVELRRSVIRGDRYRFRVRLEGHTLGEAGPADRRAP